MIIFHTTSFFKSPLALLFQRGGADVVSFFKRGGMETI
jgi:hypothetical protein